MDDLHDLDDLGNYLEIPEDLEQLLFDISRECRNWVPVPRGPIRKEAGRKPTEIYECKRTQGHDEFFTRLIEYIKGLVCSYSVLWEMHEQTNRSRDQIVYPSRPAVKCSKQGRFRW